MSLILFRARVLHKCLTMPVFETHVENKPYVNLTMKSLLLKNFFIIGNIKSCSV